MKRIKEHYLIIIFHIFRKTEFWRVHITGKELKEYILQKEKKNNKSYQQLSCRTDLMILFQSIPVSANLILLQKEFDPSCIYSNTKCKWYLACLLFACLIMSIMIWVCGFSVIFRQFCVFFCVFL